MSTLTVTTRDEKIRVRPGREITFGRDSKCTLCLDPYDVGISRFAGRINYHNTTWGVTNLSRKHSLHVVNEIGFARPLPPEAPSWPLPHQQIVGTLIVLIAGEQHTHKLTLKSSAKPQSKSDSIVPQNPVSTASNLTPSDLTQREIMTVLTAGYLRAMPHYDPRPRPRAEVAQAVGCSERVVNDTLSDLAETLRHQGVTGLDNNLDRKLCEWFATNGFLHYDDSKSQSNLVHHPIFTITQSVINEEIKHFARATARAIAPQLEPQLRRLYGESWLTTINTRYKPPRPSTLSDSRFCLKLYAKDPAADALGTDNSREQAWELMSLAHAASHDRSNTSGDAHRARELYEAIVKALPG